MDEIEKCFKCDKKSTTYLKENFIIHMKMNVGQWLENKFSVTNTRMLHWMSGYTRQISFRNKIIRDKLKRPTPLWKNDRVLF